ncbi:MAG: T9SS type A sorting domain-containing protein [Bacteroidales bacterium]|nr:T9SS type A sorting domain-containing protein [Bacteroidales bacterium]
MNITTNVLLLFISFTLFSQIIITSADLPGVGDTLHYKIATLFNFDENHTGQNVLWDFSNLTPITERADTIISVFQTPAVYNVVFNPFIANQAYINQSPPSLGIGITIEDYYDFFYKKNTFYRKAGFGAKINGIPTPVKYDNPELFFKLPLTYGTSDSSVSHFDMNIPNYGYFGQTIYRKHIADGYGQIITPFGTFNAIRVKCTINYIDTFFYEQYNFGTTIVRPPEYEYYWLTNGIKGYVAKVYKTTMFTQIEYYYDPLTNVNAVENSNNILIEFEKNIVKIFSSIDKYTISLTDITGKTIFKEKVANCRIKNIDISGLQNGVYILTLTSNEKLYSKLISKNN